MEEVASIRSRWQELEPPRGGSSPACGKVARERARPGVMAHDPCASRPPVGAEAARSPGGAEGESPASGPHGDAAGWMRRTRCAARRAAAVLLAAATSALAAPAAHAAGADGRFERRSSPSFVLYQDVGIDHRTGWRGSDQFEREVLASLESAHDRLRDLLGVDPRRHILVTIYDPAVFDAEFAGLAAFPAAGFYAGSIRVRGDVRLTPELARVLHHEYVHAALDAAAPSLALPAIVNEGLAEWFARRALGLPALAPAELQVLAAAARGDAWIPFDALLVQSFARFDPRAAALAYLESQAFVAHLVRRHGERSLLQFWRGLTRSGDLDRALARTFGRDLTQIEAELRSDLSG